MGITVWGCDSMAVIERSVNNLASVNSLLRQANASKRGLKNKHRFAHDTVVEIMILRKTNLTFL